MNTTAGSNNLSMTMTWQGVDLPLTSRRVETTHEKGIANRFVGRVAGACGAGGVVFAWIVFQA